MSRLAKQITDDSSADSISDMQEPCLQMILNILQCGITQYKEPSRRPFELFSVVILFVLRHLLTCLKPLSRGSFQLNINSAYFTH